MQNNICAANNGVSQPSSHSENWIENLGEYQCVVDETIRNMQQQNILARIWEHDHTVWKNDPTDIINRLGWLHSPKVMLDSISELLAFTDEIRGAGITHAVVCGMGGSSLAPELYRYTFRAQKGYPDLRILDSTDPGAVLEIEKSIDITKTLFIISTKSGGTVETASFMNFFYNRTTTAVGEGKVGEHFVAITDPGSALEKVAEKFKFRRTFLNDPEIGGRYSALSYFGLVPASLVGIDLKILLSRAQLMASSSKEDNNTSERLGAAMAELAIAGRDKVTFITSPSLKYFGFWVEQLIAESTGKEGKGILPVEGEKIGNLDWYANDRFFVYLRLEGEASYDDKVMALREAGHPMVQLNLRDCYDIGGEFFRWEMATAIAAHCIRINPFDQPNVEAAKIKAREIVVDHRSQGTLPELTPTLQDNGIKVYSEFPADTLLQALDKFFSVANQGEDNKPGRSYVNIQAYVKPSNTTDDCLQDLRAIIQKKFLMAVTIGYGPRFLHSTGQLHKGDQGNGLFIQLTSDMPEDVPIPDELDNNKSSMTFGILKNAQALGDRQALLDRGRHFIRFDLGNNIPAGINKLIDLFSKIDGNSCKK